MNHGSAFMLGSLLYVHSYVRKGQPSYPGFKLLVCIVGLAITGWWYSPSGMFMYLLLDSLLTMQPSAETTKNEEQAGSVLEIEIESQNTIKQSIKQPDLEVTREGEKMELAIETNSLVDKSKTAAVIQSGLKCGEYFLNTLMMCILKFLSNPVFRILSPYTYGVYLFQFTVLGLATKSKITSRVNAIVSGIANGAVDSCSALEVAGYKYDWLFVFTESIIVICLTLILAAALHWMIEKPIMCFRKQWLPKKVEKDSTTT